MENSKNQSLSNLIIFLMYIIYFGIWSICIIIKSIVPAISVPAYCLYLSLIVLYIIFLLYKLAIMQSKIIIDKYTFIVLFLLFLIIAKQILGYMEYKQMNFFNDDNILKFIIVNSIDVFMLFAIGKNFCLPINEGHTGVKKNSFIVYFIYSIIIYYIDFKYHINTNGNGVFISFYINGFVDIENEVNYLAIGDNFAILSFLVFNNVTGNKKKILIAINSMLVLYLIGSRTSLIVFGLCILFYSTVNLLKTQSTCKNLAIIFLTMNVLIAALLMLLTISKNNFINLNDNRMFSLLTNNRENDYSYQARKKIFEIGIEQIKQNWFRGQVFIEYQNGVGSYIHNIMSYWQEYGIVTFIILLFLCIKILTKNILDYCKVNNKKNEFLAMNSIYIILCVFISRAYVNPLIWFALALNIKKLKGTKGLLTNNKMIKRY